MTSAAVELGTTTSTVSRQVARLRAHLGVYPFIKTDGEWTLNPALTDLIGVFEQAEGLLESELGRLLDGDPMRRRDLRIGAPPALLSHVLVPALSGLLRAAPGLRPVLEGRVHETGLGSSDLAVVLTPPETGRLKLRRCGGLHFGLFAPRGWAHGDGWVTLTDKYAAPYLERRCRYFGSAPCLKVDSFSQAVQAMTHLGLAGNLPLAMVEDRHDLWHMHEAGLDVSLDLYMIHHESRSHDPDMRAAVDWLSRTMRQADVRDTGIRTAPDRLCLTDD